MLYRNKFVYAAMGVASIVTPALSSTRTRQAVETTAAASMAVVPVAYKGYVWALGFPVWSGRDYVWVGGDYPKTRRVHHPDVDPRSQDSGRSRRLAIPFPAVRIQPPCNGKKNCAMARPY